MEAFFCEMATQEQQGFVNVTQSSCQYLKISSLLENSGMDLQIIWFHCTIFLPSHLEALTL